MIATKTNAKPKIVGPRQHGQRMSLKAFEFVRVEEGYIAELSRGYVVVSEVANTPHALRFSLLRSYLGVYHIEHLDMVRAVLNSNECKLLIPDWESERHPDIAVYLTAPRGKKGRTQWRTWVPELVIEVVSESSRDRDYSMKRDEYWTLGVKEYWIVDAQLRQVLVLKRGRSQWTEKPLGTDDVCETKLLPGFKLPCRAIFDAAGDEEKG